MSAREYLQRIPLSRTFLIVLAVFVFIGVWMLQPFVAPEHSQQGVAGELAERRQRVEQSIAAIAIDDTALLQCVRRAALDRANIHPASPGGIDSVTELQMLYCPRNGIRDLAGIAQLKALRFLDVSGNRITSLEPLRNHPTLRSLNVRSNPLRTLEVVASLPALGKIVLPDLPLIPCRDIGDAVSKIESNRQSIRCLQPEPTESGRSLRLARAAQGADATAENDDTLTDKQQRELLEYEREHRRRRIGD